MTFMKMMKQKMEEKEEKMEAKEAAAAKMEEEAKVRHFLYMTQSGKQESNITTYHYNTQYITTTLIIMWKKSE